MNDQARQALLDLRGKELTRPVLEGTLADRCPDCPAEQAALLAAWDHGVFRELGAVAGGDPKLLPTRLAERLQQEAGLTTEAAWWAVGTAIRFYGWRGDETGPRHRRTYAVTTEPARTTTTGPGADAAFGSVLCSFVGGIIGAVVGALVAFSVHWLLIYLGWFIGAAVGACLMWALGAGTGTHAMGTIGALAASPIGGVLGVFAGLEGLGLAGVWLGGGLGAGASGVIGWSVGVHLAAVLARGAGTRPTVSGAATGVVCSQHGRCRPGPRPTVSGVAGVLVGAVGAMIVGGGVGMWAGISIGQSRPIGEWVGGFAGLYLGGFIGMVVGACVSAYATGFRTQRSPRGRAQVERR